MGYVNPAVGPLTRDPVKRAQRRLANAKKEIEKARARWMKNSGDKTLLSGYHESGRAVREAEAALKKLGVKS